MSLESYESDSDLESAPVPHSISYKDEKLIEDLHGRLQALELAARRTAVPSAASASVAAAAVSLGKQNPVAAVSSYPPAADGHTQQQGVASTTPSSPHLGYRSETDDPPIPPRLFTNYRRPLERRSTLDLDEKEDLAQIAELRNMYSRVADCLELRHKFISLSLQNECDNPKNQPDWRIYPPPPEPEYDHETKQFRNKRPSQYMPESIGADFDMDHCVIPGRNSMVFEKDADFVYQVYEDEEAAKAGRPLAKLPTLKDYYVAFDKVAAASSDGPTKTFAFRRLQYLEARWNLYILLNQYEEVAASKRIPHRDFYNVRKVDTHVHHSACMTQKHLLRFIKSKIKRSPDELVIYRDGKLLTLSQVFESLGLTAYDLNIDTLDMHAHQDAFHRFDKFNLKYNPVGESRLREIFLKTDNYLKGRYLAEITREVFTDLEQSKYQMAEYRISIYGRSMDEWSKLASWVIDNKLLSNNVRWLIQVPRLYDVYKKSGLVKNFGEVVANLFEPLFKVTQDPKSDPKLHVFLQRVIGFDSVDDESKVDRQLFAQHLPPDQWVGEQNPPYSYYIYYLYANLASLNQYRKRMGYNTFVLRPHSGEAGDPEHLICAFLTSQAISHGILLRKLPFVQFLFYLDQIGIAMSPISNNALFLTYEKNPFMGYFRRGLNVSLSTDDPLQLSFTREPLIEEYSIAIQIYKLSSVDSREIALYSVKQCGFEHELKQHWGYDMHTGEVNIEKTNVPAPRLAYRRETLAHERGLVEKYGQIETISL